MIKVQFRGLEAGKDGLAVAVLFGMITLDNGKFAIVPSDKRYRALLENIMSKGVYDGSKVIDRKKNPEAWMQNVCVPGCGGKSIPRYLSLKWFFHNCLITNDL